MLPPLFSLIFSRRFRFSLFIAAYAAFRYFAFFLLIAEYAIFDFRAFAFTPSLILRH
jgi:hypothetical protein